MVWNILLLYEAMNFGEIPSYRPTSLSYYDVGWALSCQNGDSSSPIKFVLILPQSQKSSNSAKVYQFLSNNTIQTPVVVNRSIFPTREGRKNKVKWKSEKLNYKRERERERERERQTDKESQKEFSTESSLLIHLSEELWTLSTLCCLSKPELPLE